MRKLLLIDDDLATCRLVAALLRTESLELVVANDGASGLRSFAELVPDVVLLDLRLPDADGLQLLRQLHERSPQTPVIMMTAHRDVKTAVEAMQLGATDYLAKPIDGDDLTMRIRRELKAVATREQLDELNRQIVDSVSLASQLGPSAASRQVIDRVEAVASTDVTVLITGATGTGKDLIAHAIHRLSPRRHSPLLVVDCNALPAWIVESELFGDDARGLSPIPRGSTIVLEELASLPASLQARLLHVLDHRRSQRIPLARGVGPADARFIVTSSVDLQKSVADGQLRGDLYFRLAQYTLVLPTLRERRDDIAHLARLFLEEAAVELRRPVTSFEPGALAALGTHAWPGNVRELRNVVRQAVIESREPTVGPEPVERVLSRLAATGSTPDATRGVPRTLREIAETAARAAEQQAIVDTLRATRGNKSEAARLLKTDYKTLHVKIRQLGISARDFE